LCGGGGGERAAKACPPALVQISNSQGDEEPVNTKRLLFGQMTGGRKVGKPPATLGRTFQADVRVLQGGVPNGMAWYVAAQDRARWRGLVANTTWGRGDEAAAAAGHGGGYDGGNAG
jgi:hypothetical protein